MKRHALGFMIVAAVLSTSTAVVGQTTTPSAFTFQGQLKRDGVPVEGTIDLRFTLWDDATAGAVVGKPLLVNGVAVDHGLFTVRLDFGSRAFDGEPRWLETAIAQTGAGGHAASPTIIGLRQAVTPVPYALFSLRAGRVAWNALEGVPGGFLDGIDDDTVGSLACSSGQIAKWDGQAWVCATEAVAGDTFWSLSGNAGTNARTDRLGTLDDQALELHVNAMRALRLEPDPISPNIIGGFLGNNVTESVHGATIAGGGEKDIFQPSPVRRVQEVTDHFGVVSGGAGNRAGNTNAVLDDAEYATVAGGRKNTAGAAFATVSGGDANNASGAYATIPGGQSNTAQGNHSFAAGRLARALHDGTFVWADSTGTEFSSTRADQFRVRAAGGVNLVANATIDGTLAVGNRGSVSTCCTVTNEPGCDDASCAARVCGADPVCCADPPDGGWDAVCVARAASLCGSLCAFGNASVRLPRDAISATETLDEPGVAHQAINATVACIPFAPGTDVRSLASRAIDVPTSGYVLALATAPIAASHFLGVQTTAVFGISMNAARLPDNQQMYVSVGASVPDGEFVQVVTIHGLFPVSAGTHTFYFLARPFTDTGFSVCDTQLTLLFFRTAYGDVATGADGTSAKAAAVDPPTFDAHAHDSPASLRAELASIRSKMERLQRRIEASESVSAELLSEPRP